MLTKFDLYLPKTKRKVRITVSIPRNYQNSDIMYDSLYMLDGQNIFKNNEAAFGHSLHMGKYLSIMATNFNKRICGVAISNAGSDLGRLNEYMPWKVENLASKEWERQDTRVCKAFAYDLVHTIIPFIQGRFPVKKEKEATCLMGSSLGALFTVYATNAFPDVFGAAGIFSNCPFLAPKAFNRFIHSNLNKDCRNFIYVGKKESSDGSYDENMYYSSAVKLHEFFKKNGVKSRLRVDVNGIHNEETWEKHLMSFLSFVYFDDVDIAQ